MFFLKLCSDDISRLICHFELLVKWTPFLLQHIKSGSAQIKITLHAPKGLPSRELDLRKTALCTHTCDGRLQGTAGRWLCVCSPYGKVQYSRRVLYNGSNNNHCSYHFRGAVILRAQRGIDLACSTIIERDFIYNYCIKMYFINCSKGAHIVVAVNLTLTFTRHSLHVKFPDTWFTNGDVVFTITPLLAELLPFFFFLHTCKMRSFACFGGFS